MDGMYVVNMVNIYLKTNSSLPSFPSQSPKSCPLWHALCSQYCLSSPGYLLPTLHCSLKRCWILLHLQAFTTGNQEKSFFLMVDWVFFKKHLCVFISKKKKMTVFPASWCSRIHSADVLVWINNWSLTRGSWRAESGFVGNDYRKVWAALLCKPTALCLLCWAALLAMPGSFMRYYIPFPSFTTALELLLYLRHNSSPLPVSSMAHICMKPWWLWLCLLLNLPVGPCCASQATPSPL